MIITFLGQSGTPVPTVYTSLEPSSPNFASIGTPSSVAKPRLRLPCVKGAGAKRLRDCQTPRCPSCSETIVAKPRGLELLIHHFVVPLPSQGKAESARASRRDRLSLRFVPHYKRLVFFEFIGTPWTSSPTVCISLQPLNSAFCILHFALALCA